MPVQIHHGDCIDVLKSILDASVDACLTDPPYGLSDHRPEDVVACLTAWLSGQEYRPNKRGFMSCIWDSWVPGPEVWREVLRVLKPGGHLLAFAGTRSMDLMSMAVRLAGFELRDSIGFAHDGGSAPVMAWVNGQGFPKSHNLHGDWEGWGTALKPAWEPIILARKPLIGTVSENVLTHGTGAINIDGCRVGNDIRTYDLKGGENINKKSRNNGGDREDAKGCGAYGVGAKQISIGRSTVIGRWPANVVHDGSNGVMEVFASYGERPGCRSPSSAKSEGRILGGSRSQGAIYGDTGTASRFFFAGKASATDRCGSKHPTVKPIALLRYLVRLITPPGGTVLDCFGGSGTTAQAALEEGFNAILIEREDEYVADIRRRVGAVEDRLAAEAEMAAAGSSQQLCMFDTPG